METLARPSLQLPSYQKILYMNKQDKQDRQYTYNVTTLWRVGVVLKPLKM